MSPTNDDPRLVCSVCGEPVTRNRPDGLTMTAFVHEDDSVTFRGGRVESWSDYDHPATVRVIEATIRKEISDSA